MLMKNKSFQFKGGRKKKLDFLGDMFRQNVKSIQHALKNLFC